MSHTLLAGTASAAPGARPRVPDGSTCVPAHSSANPGLERGVSVTVETVQLACLGGVLETVALS